jgi:hypothetical protein
MKDSSRDSSYTQLVSVHNLFVYEMRQQLSHEIPNLKSKKITPLNSNKLLLDADTK